MQLFYAFHLTFSQAAWAGAPRAPTPLSQAIAAAGRSVGSSAITFAAIAGTYKAVSSVTEQARGRSVRRALHLSGRFFSYSLFRMYGTVLLVDWLQDW
jgi:hypothetical protein